MKKNIVLLIIGAAVIAGAFSIAYSMDMFSKKTETKNIHDEDDLSEKEEEKIIQENIEKYQPKVTDNTQESGLNITAKTAIVVNAENNEIIYQKNPDMELPPASIIKMLTFSLALECFRENDLIEITQFASEQISNKINMKAGEKLKLSDLLYGLMMISANDAAYAIADASEGGFNKFIELANNKVRLLGLSHTTMKNPAGLDDPEQKSTVFDLATITNYALIEHPEVIDYAGNTSEHSVYATENNEPHYWFGHLSKMLRTYPYMIAAKTGYTDEAGTTYIGIAEKNGKKIFMVMMGSTGAGANDDVKNLLDFGFSKM